MSNLKKALVGIVAFVSVFVLGWKSANYYILKKLPSEKNKVETVSPVDAITSILGDNNPPKADLTTFWKVWDMLQELYIDETALNREKMVQGAIKGMVMALDDPFTVYMTADETKEFDESLNGQLEGIGAELTVRDQALVVVSPLKNSPAEKAGLQSGDIVYKIDGELTADMTLFEAIMKIRGARGTNVALTLVRKAVKDPIDVSITRDTVNVDSVALADKNNGIFVLTINQFNELTKPEFEAKIKELLLMSPKGIVMDLRNNGGGYLDTAIDLLSEFIDGKKEVVMIKRRLASENEKLEVTGEPKIPKLPLVVLINGGSASASEIVAGAIQDYKRGVIMGEQSFGKGSVQEVDKLSDGSSLRVTIAKWFTPGGKNIDKVGIKPDIEVKFTEEDIKQNRDPQMDAAINYLQNK